MLTGRINLRVTEQELSDLKQQAEIAGLSVSEYVRRRALGRRVVGSSKTDIHVLSELRKLGGLLKLVHNETRGAYSQKTAEAIQALTSYARHLEREILEREITRDRENTAEEARRQEQL